MDCPGYPNREVFFEHTPEHYTGPSIAIVIHYKPSARYEAESLAISLGAVLDKYAHKQ